MTKVKNTKGLLGVKLGMTQAWDANNKFVPVTVVAVSPNVVTQIRTVEVDGYEAVQVAAGGRRPLHRGFTQRPAWRRREEAPPSRSRPPWAPPP